MREEFYQSEDGLQLFYRDWDTPGKCLPVLCLHGLTRNGKDFIELGEHLGRRRRVLACDVRGRGRSAYDPEWQNYHPGTYVADMWRLLDQAAIERVVLIGTSMGGIMAMLMAAQQPQRIAAMVLNDIGPEVDQAGIDHIARYAGKPLALDSWEEAVAALRERGGDALPGLSNEEWRQYAHQTFREGIDGRPELDYDAAISRRFAEDSAGAADKLWALFGSLTQPALILHGVLSDILSRKTTERMVEVHPRCTVIEVPGRGHVPLLNEPVALAAIDGFLGAAP